MTVLDDILLAIALAAVAGIATGLALSRVGEWKGLVELWRGTYFRSRQVERERKVMADMRARMPKPIAASMIQEGAKTTLIRHRGGHVISVRQL
jgi:hypothetical protein